MAIKGAGLTGKQALKAVRKVMLVDGTSNVAGYTVGYACDSLGMPLAVTWILSTVTGCTVSIKAGKYILKDVNGIVKEIPPENVREFLEEVEVTSFAELMSPEDAERYLKFLETGSTEGLTSAELEGIRKIDTLLALNKINYQDILDLRNSESILEGGSKTVDISNPVLDNIRTGSALKGDPLHAFNDIIDNYAGDATKFSLTGGDGVERTLYQIEGSLNGKQSIFEWIVDPDPTKGVTHRRFIEGVGITGKPNARP